MNHDIGVSNELSRLLRKAEILISNVERGRFPDFTDYKKTGHEPEPPRALRRKSSKRAEPISVVVDEEELSLF